MCIHVSMCMCLCAYVYVCVYVHAYVCACGHVCVYVYVCVCVCVCVFVYMSQYHSHHAHSIQCCEQSWPQCCKKCKPNNSSGDAAMPPPIPRSLKNPKCTQAKFHRVSRSVIICQLYTIIVQLQCMLLCVQLCVQFIDQLFVTFNL